MTKDLLWFPAFRAAWEKRNGDAFAPWRRSRSVYCFSEGSGLPVKFGITQDVYTRGQSLQAHTWRPLFICWHVPGSAVYEAAIKQIMRPYRLHGEWFSDRSDALKTALTIGSTEDELVSWIDAIAVESGTPIVMPRERRQPPREVAMWRTA